jgi:hypothetical protein
MLPGHQLAAFRPVSRPEEVAMQLFVQLPDHLPDLLTSNQLAQLLGVGRRTVTEYARRGILPPPLKPSPRLYLFRTALVRKALALRSSPAPDLPEGNGEPAKEAGAERAQTKSWERSVNGQLL